MTFSIGKESQIDTNVILDYRTGRSITHVKLVIGDHAVIRSNTTIYSNTTIGDNLETGHNVVIREENVIGDRLSIWNSSTIDYGCQIGSDVRIHNNVYVAQFTVIEDDVFLAPGVMIANDPHPICGKCMRGPIIKKGARIGVNVTLLPRITIGEHALIGAGSVVVKDIPAKAVVYGNPAQVVGTVDDLTCPLDLVDRPYIQGLDVATRSLD